MAPDARYAAVAYEPPATPRAAADPPTHLRLMPDGPLYALDGYRHEGRPMEWVTIGSAPHRNIVVDDESVEACHCLVGPRDDHLEVWDEKLERRTMINGVPFAGTTGRAVAGNLITVGRVTFLACGRAGEHQDIRIDPDDQHRRLMDFRAYRGRLLDAPEDADERRTETRTRDASIDTVLDPLLSLRVLPHGPTLPLHEHLDPEYPDRPVVIGTSPRCAIMLSCGRISARHCLLEHRDGRWLVSDNRSRNGTFVNCVPLAHGAVELVAGNLLTVGDITLMACGRLGDAQPPRLSARGPYERARAAVRSYGSHNKAASALGVARSKLARWLRGEDG